MKRIGVLAGVGLLAAVGIVAVARRWRRRMPARLRDRSEHTVDAVTREPLRATSPTATEIAPDVYLLGPWGRTQTNAYLVSDGSSWTLVDAGWRSDGPRIEAAARSLLGPSQSPSAILLTHAHPDHAGAACELARAWGCPVYTHPAELPLATGDFAAMERYAGPLDRWLILPLMRAIGRRRREAALAGSSLAGIVQPLGPGGRIPGVEGWEWIHTPGHTPGHVAYVRARDRVVLSGDAILTLEVNAWAGLLRQRQGLSGPPWYTTWDRRAAIASISEIADLEPSVLASGHGLLLAGPGTATAVHAFAERTMRSPRRSGQVGGAERRHVSMLFADIVGFTTLSADRRSSPTTCPSSTPPRRSQRSRAPGAPGSGTPGEPAPGAPLSRRMGAGSRRMALVDGRA